MPVISSDFHGDLDKVKRFLAYEPGEKHVYCGDILDSYGKTREEQLECLNTLIASDAILLWGNHENNYRKHREPCSGYSAEWRPIYQSILEKNKQRFRNAYLADGYICTHAGIGEDFAEWTDPKMQVAELNYKATKLKIKTVGYSRGGYAPQGGIFWFDHLRDGKLSDKYNQVFGHTASLEPVEYRGVNALGVEYHHVCVNTRDGDSKAWVFNTKTKEVEEI